VWALVRAGAADVLVWNRTPERARELCAELGGRPVDVAEPADLLVNCTSAGLADPARAFEGLPIAPDSVADYGVVVDLVYGDEPTPLIRAATDRGIATVDGIEVLVRQGALSLERWTGRSAPLEEMRRAARRPGGADQA
jgi:shikimate dehydrogenase